MKKSSNRLVAILPCKFSTFVLIIVIIASLLLLPSPTLSKYVLDPIQDVLTLTSSGFSGMELTSISPIIGTTVPGEMLTAGSLQPQDATASYKWQRSSSPAGEYVDIPGATLNTYYLTVDDNNSYIRVVATGTEHYYGTVESEYTGPVITAALPVISIEPIVGAPYVGQQLVAGAVAPEVATVTYQWQKSDTLTGTYRNIEGAVGNTYTLTEEDVDKFIKVVARGSGSYGGSVGANIGPIRSNVTPLIDISPIVGSTEVGKTLVAGDLSPSGATADYQWQSSNSAAGPYTDIGGANSNTYILKNSDSGKYIKVKANGTGAYSESVVSAYTGPVATSSTPIQTIGPITGSSRVGETLTAGSITPQGATITYQWLRANAANGIYSPISGANNSTYVLKTEDYNKYIKVKASGAGAYSGTVESEPTDAVAACILVAIGPISGTTKVGELLTAGAMTPIGASVNYQWQRADPATGIYSNIDGATSSTYTLQTSDVGMYIRVVANGTDAYTGTVISLASSMVATAEQEITDLISIGDITGYIYIYETLTAGTVFPYGASVTHQWYRSDTAGGNYTPIAGATDKTYTLMPGDKGSYFKVAAIGSGFYSGTITSSYAGPITAIPLKSMGEITGTTKTWEMLTAGSISPIDSTVSYQWQKANAINGEYMDITGATEKTYTLAEDDESSFVRVIARGKNLYSGTLISSGTGPVSLTTTLVTSIDSIDGIPQVNHILTAGATSPVSATG